MNQRDHQKIIQAGFTILRRRDYRTVRSGEQQHEITAKHRRAPNWSVLHKGFKSKAERDRKMTELLADPHTLED